MLAAVESIFSQLCECSALNPDSDAEEEGGAQLFFDEAEVSAHTVCLAAHAACGKGGRDCHLSPPPLPLLHTQVIAGLPGDQRAALLAARAEAGLGLDDRAADDLDEVRKRTLSHF